MTPSALLTDPQPRPTLDSRQPGLTPQLPPGPPAVSSNPIAVLRFARELGKDPVEFQRKRFAAYGDTYTSRVGAQLTLVTRDPAHIVRVLLEDAQSYQKPETGLTSAQMKRVLGNGLVTSNGELWKEQRRQVQPAFGSQHIRGYAATMVEAGQRWVARWRTDAEIDVSEQMMGLTLQIVASVLMGEPLLSEGDELARLMRSWRASASSLSSALPQWLPYPPRWRESRVRARLCARLAQLIDRHRRAQTSDCLLSVLAQQLEQPGSMSREQLVDETLTLFFAGHETTSHALSWTLYLLSQNPDARALLNRELDEVVGSRPPCLEDVARLTYTGQVLAESMRLYPPAFTLARQARATTTLGPWDVPAGTHLILSVYHAQRDARSHRDPERFLPERFATASAAALHPGAYLPFGAGTRTCIGKRFAQLEATLLLATLCQSLSFELAQEQAPRRAADITLGPRPLRMRVQRRRAPA
ncbi:MAG: hypothetical protein RL685_926 [Pseudomonadota bacterium]